MSGAYVPATPGPQFAGEKFRVTMALRAPYTIENIEGLESRWRSAAGAGTAAVVDNFNVSFPVNGVWKATVTYHIAAGGVFSLDAVGNLCTDVVAQVMNVLSLVVVTVEHWVVSAGEAIGAGVGAAIKPATDIVHEVLNPGVLILAVVGIFLLTRR